MKKQIVITKSSQIHWPLKISPFQTISFVLVKILVINLLLITYNSQQCNANQLQNEMRKLGGGGGRVSRLYKVSEISIGDLPETYAKPWTYQHWDSSTKG